MTKRRDDHPRTEGDEPSPPAGRTMADVLELPTPLRQLANWMLRQDCVNLDDMVTHIGVDQKEDSEMLDTLVQQGFAQVQPHDETPQYRMCLVSKRRRQSNASFWQGLADKIES